MTNTLIISNHRVAEAVKYYSAYTNQIQSFISCASNYEVPDAYDNTVASIIDGGANVALQSLVPIAVRKQAGLFFTSNTLAEKVANRLAPLLQRGFKLLDPACGAGNLLLACARKLPLGHNLDETLTIWGKRILGYDLYEEFINAAQVRLGLLALSINLSGSNSPTILQSHEIFKGLKTGDVFSQSDFPQDTCIVVNPPFGYIQAPGDCKWATGKIQIASCFIERLLHKTTEGQHIVAILPDVLRSGTRYSKWRDIISSMCSSIDIESAGRFDNNTDVDVFIMHAVMSSQKPDQCHWPEHHSRIKEYEHVVSDFFDVRVGPVVPHRDSLKGPKHPYIHARTAPAWQTIDFISEERQYAGTVFSPPFLVIHRTSSPSDRHRCVTTIINETRDVAAENHLLVLQPHDKSLRSCEQLLILLKSPQTDKWLNSRIRCRHLTVSAIRELPCWAIIPNK